MNNVLYILHHIFTYMSLITLLSFCCCCCCAWYLEHAHVRLHECYSRGVLKTEDTDWILSKFISSVWEWVERCGMYPMLWSLWGQLNMTTPLSIPWVMLGVRMRVRQAQYDHIPINPVDHGCEFIACCHELHDRGCLLHGCYLHVLWVLHTCTVFIYQQARSKCGAQLRGCPSVQPTDAPTYGSR